MAKQLTPSEMAQVRRFIIESRRTDERIRPGGPTSTEQMMYDDFRKSFPHLDNKITYARFRYHNRILSENAKSRGISVGELELPDDQLLESSAPALVRIERAKNVLSNIQEEEKAIRRRHEEILERMKDADAELVAALEDYTDEVSGFRRNIQYTVDSVGQALNGR